MFWSQCTFPGGMASSFFVGNSHHVGSCSQGKLGYYQQTTWYQMRRQSWRSLIYDRNRNGPNTIILGTTDITSFSDDISPSSNTFCFQFLRNDWVNLAALLLSIAFVHKTLVWYFVEPAQLRRFDLKAIYCSDPISWVSHDLYWQSCGIL